MDLLLLIDDDKSYYLYIKDLTDLCFTKQKMVMQYLFTEFSSKSVLIKHKESCLSINGKQSVKVEKGITEFENYLN